MPSAPMPSGPRARAASPGRVGRRAFRRVGRALLWSGSLYLLAILVVPPLLPPPPAVGSAGAVRVVDAPRYLVDDSWLDGRGERRLRQTIFDEVLRMIGAAERLVLIDMFLFNDWQGPEPENHRALADELTAALIARRAERADLLAVLITDPINTVYGGLAPARFDALRDAGVHVVFTDLVPLQDSNRLWSGLWRVLVRPFGNETGGSLPNPLGPGTVTLRSWLALANFKANHRKLLVVDAPGEASAEGMADGAAGGAAAARTPVRVPEALVTSANPHDGSSAHRNTAFAFGGEAVLDLIEAERRLLVQSGAGELAARVGAVVAELERTASVPGVRPEGRPGGRPGGRAEGRHDETDGAGAGAGAPNVSAGRGSEVGTTLRVLGERRIEEAALAMLDGALAGSRVDLSMFYLADRDIVTALAAASARGARVRALLDVNRDAFGRAKNGVPNRPVAAELVRSGVAVRWCETAGEQCHAKQLYVERDGRAELLLGSGNFTRRNLHDLNLETDVLVSTPAGGALAAEVRAHFDRQWDNRDGRTYSSAYENHANESPWLTLQYRVMEASGLSTF